MNKKYLALIVILLACFSFNKSYAQGQCLTSGACSNFDNNYPTGTFTTSVTTWTTVGALIYGGEYAYYSVISGNTYEWSLLAADGGNASYDSQLSLWNQAGTTSYCYSDDYSGDDGKIQWTATFTGTVRVLISQYNCTNNSTSSTLVWRCTSCGGAQPCTCANATDIAALPYTGNGHTTCSLCTTFSMADACGNKYMRGPDHVYKYTATANGWVDIVLTGLTTVGNQNGVGLFLLNGCPSTGGTSCLEASTKQYPAFLGNPHIRYNLTSGTTYYIVVSTGLDDGSANDVYNADPCVNYNIAVITISAPIPTTQDCFNAAPICAASITGNTLSGEGNFPAEINSATSCLDGEINSAWYVFTVKIGGNLAFTLTPNTAADDYDWAVYNLTGKTCSDIFYDPSMEESSNYSATAGSTGINGSTTLTCAGAVDAQWNNYVNVNAGESYVLYVSNWNSADGYSIALGGTANYIDNVGPQLDLITSAPICGQNSITFMFSKNIQCSSISTGDFTLTGPGGPYTLSSVTSPICSAGGTYDKEFTITFIPALTSGGTYTLNLIGSVTDICNNTTTNNSLSFLVSGVSATVAGTNPSCFGANGSAVAYTTGGTAPYTYSWNSSPVQVTQTASNLPVGTYTVTVTDAMGVCQDVQTVIIANESSIFSEDFDPAPVAGWTHGIIAGTDTWATGDPQAGNGDTGLGREDPTSDHTPNDANNHVYGENLGAGTNGGYVNNTNEWLSTPVINCTGATGVKLNFWRWANCENSFDEAYVEYSTNGSTWTDLAQPLYYLENQWTLVSISVAGAANQPTVYFRWRMTSDGSITYSGWNVDDVSVTRALTQITGTFTQTNVQCSGGNTGSATVSPSGGSPGYTYSWQGGGAAATKPNLTAGTYTVTITDSKGCTGSATVTITQPASGLSATASSTNVLCFGNSTGSATANPSGGSSPYSYNWSGGGNTQTITNKPAGIYTVTVTDLNSCTATATTTITQPASGLTVTTTSTSVSCFGNSTGTATANPVNGTPGYTYFWQGGGNTQTITGKPAGTYGVTVSDASGCTATASAVITQPASGLTVTTTATNVNCFGNSTGNATANPNNGTPGYSYSWQSGENTQTITGKPTGTYGVTVTDASGCSSSATATITQPAFALSVTASKTDVSCFSGSNGTATATPSGGTASYTYFWSTGVSTQNITGRPAGTYSVTVTDANGCTAQTSVAINQPAFALSVTMSKTDVNCFGGSDGTATATPSGGTPTYTYTWSTGTSGQNITARPANSYSVTVTDANSCTTVGYITITQPAAAVSGTIAGTNVTVFGGNNGSADLTPAGGTPPYTYNWSNSATSQDLNSLVAGIYCVTISDSHFCTGTACVTITQPGSPLIASITPTHVNCNGGATGAAALTVSGGTPPYSYSWSNGVFTQNLSNITAGVYSVIVTDASATTTTVSVTITQPAALTASITATNVACSGGTTGAATLTVNGGSPAYAFTWNFGQTTQNLSGIAAGTYCVTVTDTHSCTATACVTITQPATAVSVTISGTNVSCNGTTNGAADLTPSGGTSPYTYSWSSGQTSQDIVNIGAGTYCVTITDSQGCMASGICVTITAPAVLTVSVAVTNTSCNGLCDGTATATANGGTIPYTYLWSTLQTPQTISSLCNGSYSVTVTDANGCTALANNSLTQPVAMILNMGSTNSACGLSTGTASVTVTNGASPYDYIWSNASSTMNTPLTNNTINNLAAGSYTVTVTDNNGCTISSTANVSDAGAPTTTGITNTNVKCNGGSDGTATITISGGVSPYDYVWSNGYTLMNSPSLTNTASGLSAGTISVIVTDNNNCSTNASVVITQPSLLTASITAQSDAACNGENTGSATVTAIGGSVPYSYLWDAAAGNQPTATSTGLGAGTYTVTISDLQSCNTTANVTISAPAALNASITPTNVHCLGATDGVADLSVSGGTLAYTYNWSPVASTNQDLTNIPAGTYIVTVTDAHSCTTTASVTITGPASGLSATVTGTDVSCFGGSDGTATLVVTGGTPPDTYSWNTGPTTQNLTGLSTGTYSVTVTDLNGCTTSASVTITQSSSLTAIITKTNADCNGGNDGTATITAGGGTPGYTYEWTGGQTTSTASGLTAGAYTVTVTDSDGCSITTSATITEPAAMTASIAGSNVSCNGGSDGGADLSVVGGTPLYSYTWLPGGSTSQDISGLQDGTFNVTVNDANGCTATGSVTITEPASPPSATAAQTDVTVFGGSDGTATLTVTGGTAGYTFVWSNGTTTQNLTGLSSGTYCVTISDANSCTFTTCVIINEPGSMSSYITGTNISCYGNSTGAADLYVSGGIPPYTYSWSNLAVTQDLSNIAAGVYDVTVTDSNGITTTSSVTITQPSQLSATITTTNITCFGNSNGAAHLSVTTGTPPYTYNWSDGTHNPDLYGVPAGVYLVTVTDFRGCTATATCTITQPASGMTSTITQSDVGCYNSSNGSATITINGGTMPFSYSWSNGDTQATADSLYSGIYYVTVTDANVCTTTANVTISQPTNFLTLSLSKNNVHCNGGSDGLVVATVTGGTPPYLYLWAGGQTMPTLLNVPAGFYEVTVTDLNGCTISASTFVKEPLAITTADTITNVSCYGESTGSVDLTVAGGTVPYTYSWSNGTFNEDMINVDADIYYVTITDANGCKAYDTIEVDQPAGALIATAAATNILCHGAVTGAVNLTVTGGSIPYNYYWNYGQQTEDISNLPAATYSVTVVDANSCMSSVSVPVTQPADMQIIITVNDVLCSGDTTGSATIVIIGGVPPLTYLWSDNSSSNILSNAGAGTYTVTITDNNGCVKSETVTILNPDSLAITIGKKDIKCKGDKTGAIYITSVTGGRPAYTFVWNNAQVAQSLTNLFPGYYDVTVTDANGCSLVTGDTIFEPDSALNAILTLSSTANCLTSNDGFIDLTVSGGTPNSASPYYFYNWSNAITTEDLDSIGPGLYGVTITDANSCILDTSVTLNGKPFATINGSNLTCYGANDGVASVQCLGGVMPYHFLWNTMDTTTTIQNLGPGTYTIFVTDFNGCGDTAQVTIVQPGLLTSNIVVSNALCYGDSTGGADMIVTGGTLPVTYEWSSGEDDAAISNKPSGTYICTVTDFNGCVSVDSITINQPTEPIQYIFIVTNVTCHGGNNGIIDIIVTGGTPGYTYSWNYGQVTPHIDTLLSGIYRVTVTDDNLCTEIDSVVVDEPNEISIPQGIITTPTSCGATNGTAELPGISGGSGAFSWIWSPGQVNVDSIGGLAYGDYFLAITDTNNCEKIFNFSINLTGFLEISSSVSQIACHGGYGSISASPNAGFQPYTYVWSNGQTTSTASNLLEGPYMVTVTDALGCIGVFADTVWIDEEPSQMVYMDTITTVTCKGFNNGYATVHTTGGTTFAGSMPYNYGWWKDSLLICTDSIANNLTPFDYIVVVTDSNNCVINVPIKITEPALTLEAAIDTVFHVTCYRTGDGVIQINPIGGTSPYTYLWPDGQTTSGAVKLVAGTYIVTMTDIRGCIDTTKIIVTQPEPILITDFVTKPISCRDAKDGSLEITTVIGGVPGYTYLWDVNGKLVPNKDIAELGAGKYHVTITDANSCPYVDTLEVAASESPCLEIPTCFTPNGDNKNDKWEIKNIHLYPEVTVEIYNRWGELLFKSTGYQDAWDGTYNGNDVPVGSYVYIVNLHNDYWKPESGIVTIIR